MQRLLRPLLACALVAALMLFTASSPQSSPLKSSASAALLKGSPNLAPQETDGEITKANWMGHPKIKQVRAVVQAVNAGLSRKTFTVRKRAFEYCEPYADAARTLATDSRGRARFYKNEGGSDDSALKWEHYYDDAGHLRFVLITGGAVNGSELEHRIYFDETGKRIWEEQTYKKGPGYTFPKVWPDDQLQITDPAGKFSSASPCPEVKPQAGKRKRTAR
jgi:hypothetical protein